MNLFYKEVSGDIYVFKVNKCVCFYLFKIKMKKLLV